MKFHSSFYCYLFIVCTATTTVLAFPLPCLLAGFGDKNVSITNDKNARMINDNAVDAGSGLFNVLRGWTGIIRGADSKTELDDDEEDESDLLEADEYQQVTDLLSGKRGWGYSKKIEGQSLKF